MLKVLKQACFWLLLPSTLIANAGLTLERDAAYITISPSGRAVAFLDKEGRDLRFSLMKETSTYRITDAYVGPSFFWTKDGRHIVYREQSEVTAKIFLYNTFTRSSKLLKEIPGKIGYLTYDPPSESVHFSVGDVVQKLSVLTPAIKKGKWQKSSEPKYFVVQSSGALLINASGETKRFEDDRSGVTSFSVSPDGDYLAWATREAKIYVANRNGEADFFDYGRDPAWHPSKHVLLYSGARLVGTKVIDFDIKEADLLTGEKFFLTRTQDTKERFPVFEPHRLAIWYTVDSVTEILKLPHPEKKLAPAAERSKKMQEFFTPRPGMEITVDERAFESSMTKSPLRTSGQILVRPPARVCLTITKSKDQPDETVCKKTFITYTLEDLDPETGELHWRIQRSDESESGIDLTWKTPYRFARTIELGNSVGATSSQPLAIKRCTSHKNEFGEKEIILDAFGEDLSFKVTFPNEPQPLVAKEPAPKEKTEEKDKAAEKKPAEAKKEEEKPRTWDDSWNLSYVGTYLMDGNRFQSTRNTFPGRRNTVCRYTLPQGTRKEARLECHNTADYAFFFAPLACF